MSVKGAAVLTAIVAVAGVCAAPSLAAVSWFLSPSGNISCEVASNRGKLGTYAFCETVKAPRSVLLHSDGSMKVCSGVQCLGNAPLDAFTLGYGKSVRVGPFRCTSLTRGMRCIVARSGHGFLISRDSLQKL
jgi:hypothetical protein